jgi:hypothetical protein
MHGHVVAHGDDTLVAVEECARVVAALLDVGRDRRAPQRSAHLFCDGMNAALKDCEFDGVDGGAHACTSMTRLPKVSTCRRSPGGRMVAELYSEMMAGPAKASPACSRSRS